MLQYHYSHLWPAVWLHLWPALWLVTEWCYHCDRHSVTESWRWRRGRTRHHHHSHHIPGCCPYPYYTHLLHCILNTQYLHTSVTLQSQFPFLCHLSMLISAVVGGHRFLPIQASSIQYTIYYTVPTQRHGNVRTWARPGPWRPPSRYQAMET